MLYLNLCLHILNGIRGLNLKGDGFPSKGFDEDLHFETFFVLNFFKTVMICVCCNFLCDWSEPGDLTAIYRSLGLLSWETGPATHDVIGPQWQLLR